MALVTPLTPCNSSSDPLLWNTFIVPVEIGVGIIVALPITEITRKLVSVTVDSCAYVCKPPNTVEKD